MVGNQKKKVLATCVCLSQENGRQILVSMAQQIKKYKKKRSRSENMANTRTMVEGMRGQKGTGERGGDGYKSKAVERFANEGVVVVHLTSITSHLPLILYTK